MIQTQFPSTPALLVRKTLDFRFVKANTHWIEAANFKSGDDFVGLTDEDCVWADYRDYTVPHEQDAINGITYSTIHLGMLYDDRPAWIHNHKYLDTDRETGEQFLQVVAHEISNPQWVQFLSHMQRNNRYGTKQFYIGKPTQIELSEKEKSIMFFVMQGQSAKEISTIMNRSPRTIEDYIASLKAKLNCSNKSQLIEAAFCMGYAQTLHFG